MPPKKTTKPATKKSAASKAAPKKKKAASAEKTANGSRKLAKKSITTGVPRPSLGKKASPISFSIEDAQSVVETRQKEEANLEKTAPAAKPAPAPAPKKTVPVADIPTEKRKLGAASLADILGFNPAAKKPETELEENEIPKKWVKFYRLLIELRKHVKDELDLHTADTLKRSNRDSSGDLSGYGQHQADAATDNFDRDFALSLLSAEQDALYEIEEAIKRIKNDAYGHCEVTGEPIKKERLAAVPFTRFSVEGQKEFEKNRRRKIDRGGAFADTSEGVSLASDDDSDD